MTAMQHVNGHASAEVIERLVALGDLDGLKPMERTAYYMQVCEKLGLNPLTQPFAYIKLNGKLTLYAKRDTTDQLRKIHCVSVVIVKRERVDDLCIVTARATTPDGRTDESIGAVSLMGLKGEALANALMKAETKAKRRVTLSICGLGWLDETEVQDIRGAKPVRVVDGEILEQPEQPPSEPDFTKQLAASIDWHKWAADHLGALRNAANKDRGSFNEAWADITADVKKCHPSPEYVEALNAGKNEIKAAMGWK